MAQKNLPRGKLVVNFGTMNKWSIFVRTKLWELGYSQRDLAREAGYTETYISMLLHNKKEFSSEYSKAVTHRKVLEALGRLEDKKDENRETET